MTTNNLQLDNQIINDVNMLSSNISGSFNNDLQLDDIRKKTRNLAKRMILDDYNNIDLTSKGIEGTIDVIDMFSGCGGMSFGFKLLSKIFKSYNLKAAIDLNESANKTYKRNYNVDPKQIDVRELLDDEVTLSSLKKDGKRPLVLIGCAPCQGFSSHNKRSKEKDERNSLVEAFAQVAVKLDPTFIIMENVPELLSKKHWEHFSAFKEILESHGYIVRAQIINMAEFGVPQERYRAIVLASKENFLMPIGLLDINEYRTVRQAIGDLPKIKPGEKNAVDQMHLTSNHQKSTIEVISQVPKDGGNRPKHIGPKWYQDVYGRLFWDRPSITITTCARNPASGRYVHPEQNRGLSIREAASLQSFPNDFIFEGNFGSVFTQIGNAVPPKFSIYLALHLIGEIFGDSLPDEIYRKDEQFDINIPIKNSFKSITDNAKKKQEIDLLW